MNQLSPCSQGSSEGGRFLGKPEGRESRSDPGTVVQLWRRLTLLVGISLSSPFAFKDGLKYSGFHESGVRARINFQASLEQCVH